MTTKIEWCDETINPIQDVRKGKSGRGYNCTKVSAGCENCYAERINIVRGNHLPFGDTLPDFELIESELQKPLRWKKPKAIFWQSMGDLFHPSVPFNFINSIMGAVHLASRHCHLFLTKRPERMAEYFIEHIRSIIHEGFEFRSEEIERNLVRHFVENGYQQLYKGLTICNQAEADRLIPIFLEVPGKKFLSIEPMLGPIGLRRIPSQYGPPVVIDSLDGYSQNGVWTKIDAVILGGETGQGARPMHPDWVRSVRDQCFAAGVPFFFKQWGEWIEIPDNFPRKSYPTSFTDPKMESFRIICSRGHVGKMNPGTWLSHNHFEDHYTGEGDDRRAICNPIEVMHVGRKKSGRLLDGREHNDLPWRTT